MRYFKDNEDNVHAIDEGFEHLLPEGSIAITKEEADAIATSPLTPEQIKAALEAALDAHINSVAQAKGYDSRITAALRAGYPNPWQQEGIAFGQWMDACYTKAFAIQAEVEAGARPIPTAEELIAEMPEMVWPT